MGPLQAPGVRPRHRLSAPLERTSGGADDVPAPRPRLSRGRPARRRKGSVPQGEDGRARREARGPRHAAGAEQPATAGESGNEEEGGKPTQGEGKGSEPEVNPCGAAVTDEFSS